MRGDRVGVVGPNGAGKTTLLNLLTGALAPDTGAIRLGTNLAPITLDQRRESLDPKWTLAEAMTGGSGDTVTVGGESRNVIGYMKDFLFRPEQARTPVGVLSGGERARLTLACGFARPSNLLVLDEPTNDLDLETLDLLQEKLAEYAGTVLLVSHDRDFIDRVVTSMVASEGNGNWVEYAGGYTDMLAQRLAAQPAASPAKPGRVKQPRPAAQGGGSPAAARRRMNFNDQRALELLPARIAALETQIADLTAILGDPNLYVRDPERFGATTSQRRLLRPNPHRACCDHHRGLRTRLRAAIPASAGTDVDEDPCERRSAGRCKAGRVARPVWRPAPPAGSTTRGIAPSSSRERATLAARLPLAKRP